MEIGGFQKLSLIDYKGKVACIVFTIGCNLRCPFCYVPQLVIPDKAKKLKRIPEEEIFRYLEKNKYLLDGVVITGGEPTLQKDLKEFIKKVKKIGNFSIAIETNGTNPKV
ncbi:MAG: radical SAM protein, partial [Candidatus Aenigmatarchaeota archaeon]